MGEPLKGKIRTGKQLMNDNYEKYRETELFLKPSVESAVEWLKDEVLIRRITHSDTLDVPCSNILELIDEAFPDLQTK